MQPAVPHVSEWPMRTCRQAPVAASHTRAVQSLLSVSTRAPSAVISASLTPPVWPVAASRRRGAARRRGPRSAQAVAVRIALLIPVSKCIVAERTSMHIVLTLTSTLFCEAIKRVSPLDFLTSPSSPDQTSDHSSTQQSCEFNAGRDYKMTVFKLRPGSPAAQPAGCRSPGPTL